MQVTGSSTTVLCVNGGTMSVVRVHSSVRSVVPQSSGAPNSSNSRSWAASSWRRRRAAICTCVSSSTERIGSPPRLSTRSVKRRVGSAVCSARAASRTVNASSGIARVWGSVVTRPVLAAH